jgi:hypothetical protein
MRQPETPTVSAQRAQLVRKDFLLPIVADLGPESARNARRLLGKMFMAIGTPSARSAIHVELGKN